jgi:hypothetical protein
VAGPWPDLFGVKAASNCYVASGRYGLYVVTRAYVLGCAAWWWRVLESMFPLCSFRGRVIRSCAEIQEARRRVSPSELACAYAARDPLPQ